MQKSIGRLLSILHRQSQVYMNTMLKDYHITSSEYIFLIRLYKQDGITQDNLSSFLYIDKAATTRAMQSLELKGYIKREKDNNDKRCNHIFLTDKAWNIKEELLHRVYSWSDLLTMDMEDSIIEQMITTLEHMVDKVEESILKKHLEET